MANKKKLLYITRYSLHQEFNLKKKFDGQLNAFKNLGFDVFLIGFDENNFYLINDDKKTVIGKTHFSFPSYLHTRFYVDLNKVAIKAIEAHKFDYVYWRAAPLWKSSCTVAEKAKEVGSTLIYEIPTYPLQEAQLSGLRSIFAKYSKRFDKVFHSYVDAYVLIGEDAGGEYRGKPAINIENGIDLSTIQVRKPKKNDDTIHILALASMCYWHGYDRLIKSLSEYKGKQKVKIHMVGGNDGGSLDEWKELSEQLGLADSIIFHGQMTGEALEEMFNLCDIGVNSLAMYRKGFSVTMELKTREYAARGLPFVCAVKDPSFDGIDSPKWLKVDNNDSIPDMQTIVDFALNMKNDDTHVGFLRKIAEERMTWEMQYKKVFDVVGGK